MQDLPDRLSGPDFLEAVADVEAANDHLINADVYRQRARQWKQLEADYEQLQQRNATLQRTLDRLRGELQVA